MKKLYTTLVAVFAISQFSYAQQWTTSGSNIYNSNAGNVGIGTTSPNAKLDVQGGNISIYNNGGSSNIFVGSAATGKTNVSLSSSSDANGYGVLQSVSSAGSSYGNTVINPSGGNVGIGTTSPAALLSVQGGGTTTGISNIETTLTARFNTANPPIVLGIGYVSSDNPFIQAFNSGTSSTRSLIINPFGGNVGIGTTTPDVSLAVAGTIHSKEVKVDLIGWPDFVFKPTYKLPSLTEVKSYIDQNQHLPDMPSAQEVEKDGINLGELVKVQTKKIEELTLYLIEKDKQLKDQQDQLTEFKKELKALAHHE
jgi:hypothetical protein